MSAFTEGMIDLVGWDYDPNVVPSKATRLEYDSVTKVVDSEFFLQRENA